MHFKRSRTEMACMKEMRNAYKILVDKPEENNFGDLEVGRRILKWVTEV